MSRVFRSEAARAALHPWFETFRAQVPHPTESRRLATSFGETHLLVGGPVDAPPLVLFHGAMASSAHALAELWPLLERFRVHAIDVLGQSPMSADLRLPVKGDAHGRWADELFPLLGLESAHVLGISWGGFVSTRLAVQAPGRIRRLALLVPAGLVTGPAWHGFWAMGWPMTAYLMAPSPARLERLMAPLLTTPDEGWKRYLGEAFLAHDMRGMQVPPLATPQELATFKAPTLAIGAELDVSFPGQLLLDRARTLFPGLCDTELLRESRHCPPTTPEFRAWLGKRVGDFLAA